MVRSPRPPRAGWRRSVWTACALLFAPAAAGAIELRLGAEPYNYAVLDQDLRVVLREFGANTGVRVDVSEGVQGRVRGRLPVLPPREFLDRLTALYGLDWFYDGYAIHVTSVHEGMSEVLSLPGVPFGELRASLAAMGLDLSDPRCQIRALPQSGLVQVAGPPRYVELVKQAAAALATNRPAPTQVLAPPAAPPPPPARSPAAITIYRGAEVRRVPLDGGAGQ